MKPTLNDTDRAKLNNLVRSLSTFRLLSERMPLNYVMSFLAVAQEEGLSVSDYAERLGLSISTMSRHLLDIGERNRTMDPGHGLIFHRANPNELRKHQYFLTTKGKTLLGQILRELK